MLLNKQEHDGNNIEE